MTKEQYEILSECDQQWESLAAGATVVRGITLAMQKKCTPIYKELFGKPVSQSQWSCPHCAFRIYKEIALAYVEYKNKPKRGRKPNGTTTKTA